MGGGRSHHGERFTVQNRVISHTLEAPRSRRTLCVSGSALPGRPPAYNPRTRRINKRDFYQPPSYSRLHIHIYIYMYIYPSTLVFQVPSYIYYTRATPHITSFDLCGFVVGAFCVCVKRREKTRFQDCARARFHDVLC